MNKTITIGCKVKKQTVSLHPFYFVKAIKGAFLLLEAPNGVACMQYRGVWYVIEEEPAQAKGLFKDV